MSDATRVVYDCNTFVQAFASPGGPAGRCVQLALDGKVQLFVSPAVLAELRDVLFRPKVIAQLHLRPDRIDAFIEAMAAAATMIDSFAAAFEYPRDPDDAHYVNLALAAGARLIVSRDNDLLDLMSPTSPDALDFQRRFPSIRVLDPVAFLAEVAAS
jgi:putative PIN family toxin of toxin-antitoxin system